MKVGDKMKGLFHPREEGGEAGREGKVLTEEILTEIIHKGRVENRRSREIARDIVEYFKKNK